MPLFRWTDSYSVNIKSIDEQHKKLLDIINELHEAMKAGKGKEALNKIFNELVDYTRTHFSFEEKLMEKYGYSESALHKQTHQNLIKQLNELKENYEKGNTNLSINVMNFLQDWLIGHIQGSDKKYTAHLNAKGVY
ncbi:Hemerythrin HHE cation binding region [Melioribacter roseus P3M-2]|jgi:hemerythrin|uniref:Hemerythrin HHE cation binding region n=1 Tax=Melioribacter roseus (strain DSM 23840 / JCM 17771 / VKM B-2668 / P3M-2) TaxID=1191523 RepID=I6ZP92_MELRP|nr:bacteriohemerythrin [Melioribacter roseus]AFN73859.1 Hemerythrin HHE cation binding region [Melioribacter roseus P3M-2]